MGDTPTLPPLSDSEERLFQTYISLNFNLDLLAEHSQTPVLRLLRWLNLPGIREYLRAIDDLRARQAQAADQSDRRAAIDALKQVLTDSQDPTEKRRAATAIIRALSARPRPGPDSAPHDSGPRTQDVPLPAPAAPPPQPSPPTTPSAPSSTLSRTPTTKGTKTPASPPSTPSAPRAPPSTAGPSPKASPTSSTISTMRPANT